MADDYRQKIIARVRDKLMQPQHTEATAMALFLWHLMELEPPITPREQLLFCAHFRMYKGYQHTQVENKQEAIKLLEIAPDKQNLSGTRLRKEAKLVYWRQYNQLTSNLWQFQSNAIAIGAKRKALNFICNDSR